MTGGQGGVAAGYSVPLHARPREDPPGPASRKQTSIPAQPRPPDSFVDEASLNTDFYSMRENIPLRPETSDAEAEVMLRQKPSQSFTGPSKSPGTTLDNNFVAPKPRTREEAKRSTYARTIGNPPANKIYKPLGSSASAKTRGKTAKMGLVSSTRVAKVRNTATAGASKRDNKPAPKTQPRASSLTTKEPPKPLGPASAKRNGSFVVQDLKKGESPGRKKPKPKAHAQSVGIGSSLYRGPKSEMRAGQIQKPKSTQDIRRSQQLPFGSGLQSIRSGPV